MRGARSPITPCGSSEAARKPVDRPTLVSATSGEVAATVRMTGYGVRSLDIRGFYSYAMPTSVTEAFARTIIPRFR
jgi:hypothetical protein